MSTCYTQLLRFSQQFQKFYARQFLPVAERAHLTMREIHVLLFLANNPGYDTARDIAVLRGLSKSQVSQAVDLLAAEGFLQRTPDPRDRRVVHLAITDLGAPVARSCQAIQEQCSQRLLSALTPEEQIQFRTLLRTILERGIPEEEEESE